MGRLRIEEETPPPTPNHETTEATVRALSHLVPVQRGLDEWRKLAVQSGERLQYAENQLKDLRTQADELRARNTKSKTRLDSANERINELQTQLVSTTAERDELRDRVARQDAAKRKAWELFQEL